MTSLTDDFSFPYLTPSELFREKEFVKVCAPMVRYSKIMNRDRRQMKQLQSTIRMKQDVLIKQKVDLYELLDDVVHEIAKKIEGLIPTSSKHADNLDKAKDLIHQLDQASELFTQIFLMTDSYLGQMPEDSIKDKQTGSKCSPKKLSEAETKCSPKKLSEAVEQKAKIISPKLQVKTTTKIEDKLADWELRFKCKSEEVVKTAVCTQLNQNCAPSPLFINTRNLNLPKGVLTDKLVIPIKSPAIEEVLNVIVIDVDHPWSFHVQLVNDRNLQIATMIRNHICSGQMQLLEAAQDLYCLAKFEDNCFYRAKITSIQGELIRVKYVDYGNAQMVTPNDIYALPPNLAAYPANALWCALGGVCPNNEEVLWPEEAIQLFQHCVQDQQVKLQRLSSKKWHSSHPLVVKVIFMEHSQGASKQCHAKPQSLCKTLIQAGLAKPIELHDLINELNKSLATGDGTVCLMVQDCFPPTSLALQNNSHADRCEENMDKKVKQNSSESGLMVNEKLTQFTRSLADPGVTKFRELPEETFEMDVKVMLSSVLSPGSFFVHCVDEKSKEMLEKIQAELNSSYNHLSKSELVSQNKTFHPTVNSPCCAMSSEDNLFYRGFILDIERITNKFRTTIVRMLIFFIDYGDYQWVPSDLVFPLTENLKELKSPVLWCSLRNIKPVSHPTAWSSEAVDSMKQMMSQERILHIVTSKKQLSAIQYHNIIQVTPLLVHLVVQNFNGEELCVNHELISLELARLDDSYTPLVESDGADKDYEWDPMFEDFTSLRNSYKIDVDDPGVALVGYSSNQRDKNTRRVCVFYNRQGGCRRGQYCPNMHIQEIDPGRINDKVQILLFEEDQTQLVPMEGTKCFVTVTFVISPVCFFVNFVNNSSTVEESLEDLLENMNKFYQGSIHYDGDLTLLARHQAVAAKVEDYWIRGKVLDIDVERSLVEVMSVDLGSKHFVKEKDIRELDLRFIHLTPQAVECSLADVEPLEYLGHWTEEVCSIFKDMIEGNQMTAEVICRFSTEPVLVSLHEITSSSTSISQSLVDLHLARKKIFKTKFAKDT